MQNDKFIKILYTVLILCALITIIHMGYIVYAYRNSSIIRFIARELWFF